MIVPILAKVGSWLGGGIIESAGKAATDIGKTYFGDKTEREQHLSAEQLAVLNQYAAEFVARTQRTWWDSFVDGINRLVRPGLAVGAQAAFVWVYVDPVGFSECMQALQLVPEMLWYLWLTIFGFFFGGRIIETAPKTWKIEPKSIELAKEIAAGRTERIRADAADKAAVAAEKAAEVAVVAAEKSIGIADKNIEVAEKRIEVEKERQVTEEARAPPLPSDNSTDAIRAVAATIWGEARGEGPDGMLAVGCVIRNRTQSPGWWGKDWVSVCTAPKQFSCWWDKQGARVRSVDETDTRFLKCLEIARSIVDGSAADITGGADHYHTGAVSPSWSRGIKPVAIIGAHRFFRLGKAAGSYRG